jgi:hypothetical protein
VKLTEHDETDSDSGTYNDTIVWGPHSLKGHAFDIHFRHVSSLGLEH